MTGDMTNNALLWFRTYNARSYRDDTTLRLSEDQYARHEDTRMVPTTGMAQPTPVSPVAGIFGANASGKSALLLALSDMRAMVLNSFRHGRIEEPGGFLRDRRDHRTSMGHVPFRFSDPLSDETYYYMHLLLDGVHWAYGFGLSDVRIISEAARHWPRGREARVFNRSDYQDKPVEWGQSHRSTAQAVKMILSDDALVLSINHRFGSESTDLLSRWFHENLWLASTANRSLRTAYTASLLDEGNEDEVAWIQRLMGYADIGQPSTHIRVEREQRRRPSEEAVRVRKNAGSSMRSADWRPEDDARVPLDFMLRIVRGDDDDVVFRDESAGTREWVSLIGVVAHALSVGTTVLVDELDRSLHPRLVELVVGLFQSRASNPHGAQLIFNANDTSLMGRKDHRILAPHQVWLTERGAGGASLLRSLEDWNPQPKDDMQECYLRGMYGGVPIFVGGGTTEADHA